MKKICIFGAGGFGREVKMLIDQINTVSKQFEFIGYFDDEKKKGEIVTGYPIIGSKDDLNSFDQEASIVYAIGSPHVKRNLIQYLSNPKIQFATLIHPSCWIGTDDVVIGEGSIICAGCIITINVSIGKNVILNLACTVGHDTVIKDYSSFMPAVNISGEVNIDEGVYVGTGAKIINQLEIGEYTTVGAGAVVSKTLPSYCTAVGIPAKPIKFHEQLTN